jgi:hypothetical protein
MSAYGWHQAFGQPNLSVMYVKTEEQKGKREMKLNVKIYIHSAI